MTNHSSIPSTRAIVEILDRGEIVHCLRFDVEVRRSTDGLECHFVEWNEGYEKAMREAGIPAHLLLSNDYSHFVVAWHIEDSRESLDERFRQEGYTRELGDAIWEAMKLSQWEPPAGLSDIEVAHD